MRWTKQLGVFKLIHTMDIYSFGSIMHLINNLGQLTLELRWYEDVSTHVLTIFFLLYEGLHPSTFQCWVLSSSLHGQPLLYQFLMPVDTWKKLGLVLDN